MIPGFPRIEALRFEGWLFADWEDTSLGGIPRRLRVTGVHASCGDEHYYIDAPEDADWFAWSSPPKRPPRPMPRNGFVGEVATGGHL